MKKKTWSTLGIVVVVILFLVICCPIIFLPLFVLFQESPAKPQIEYGEFDFSLVYSVNGEEVRVDDTLVCEYDGVSKQLDGVSNKWKTYIKGTDDDKILISENENGKIYLFLPSDARYYMDDPEFEMSDLQIDEKPWFVYENNDLVSTYDEEQRALAGFEVIEWEIEGPIENIYK